MTKEFRRPSTGDGCNETLHEKSLGEERGTADLDNDTSPAAAIDRRDPPSLPLQYCHGPGDGSRPGHDICDPLRHLVLVYRTQFPQETCHFSPLALEG